MLLLNLKAGQSFIIFWQEWVSVVSSKQYSTKKYLRDVMLGKNFTENEKTSINKVSI